MTRPPRPHATPRAVERMERFHASTVAEVQAAIAAHAVVVVGMKWNPHVPKARKTLDAAGIAYHYLEYGSYAVAWKPRLAIKLWSGWPTFPQVFVKGTLIGGATDLTAALADGSFKALIDA